MTLKRLAWRFACAKKGSTQEAIAFSELAQALQEGGAAIILRNAIAGLFLPGTDPAPSAGAAGETKADAAPVMRKA